jgi:hypothetical protein
MPRWPVDIVGKRFGRLVVLRYIGASYWHLICDCGKETSVKTDMLNGGRTRSCGCLLAETTRARSLKHGHSRGKKGKAYRIWTDMRSRCNNPRVTNYALYGGRGISICERWNDFANFFADMGEPPPGLSLDRIDVNGNYEPGNCRWIDQNGQQNNRRNNHLLTHNGETYGITEWSRRTGVYRHTIRRRLERGWPIEKALTP